jgi:hypothetical protein
MDPTAILHNINELLSKPPDAGAYFLGVYWICVVINRATDRMITAISYINRV